jgi:xanthine dehydrogenase accessory factor
VNAWQLRATAERWRREGRAAVVVEVQEAKGSVPRENGTRMLVAAGEVAGTIGGGHLELQAIAQARRGELGERRMALGPSLGQCCGGALLLRFLDLNAVTDWPLPPPRFHLDLYGAGHVGRAIAVLLANIDCRVRWIDERADEFPRLALAPHIEVVCTEVPEQEARASPEQAHVLVLTHRHDLDLRIVEAVLRNGRFQSLGLIGSQTKRARFIHRLEAMGLATDRLQCPIGLPAIRGKEPEVIAVSVVAQLLSN